MESEATGAAKQRQSSQPPLAGLRILLVEDHEDSRDALVDYLEMIGATLLPAGSSHQAFELLQRHQPNFIVSDIGLPDEDGNHLMRRIRQLSDAEGGTVPAVALTAYTRSEDRKAALAAGFDAFLAKPVNLDQLTSTIAALAGRRA